MNLSDIITQATNLEQSLIKIQQTIEDLRTISTEIDEWENKNIEDILNINISDGSSNAIGNARTLRSKNREYYIKFLQQLREINFFNSSFILSKMENKFEYFNMDRFIQIFIQCTEIIHKFTCSKSDNKVTPLFFQAIHSVNTIIKQYDNIIRDINKIKNIGYTLIGSEDDKNLKIRFLKEDNEVASLINNITLINSIYDNINSLIGDESEKLKYKRAESGTFEINLTGCVNTLAVLLPMLKFSYNIYTENFSWKAKQERKLGEIKVRKEYLELIKEVKELNTTDEVSIKNILGNLDENIKELFINNPCIQVNNERIGIEEMKGKNIPIELLNSSETEIDTTLDADVNNK
ncbi:hypothetical protein G4W71_02670 [Clostridium botulinum]|uniref:hypothetical protein n=1 Tax=Clostridium botulinum TaxID=1491 RepID=UPI001788CD1C|nr:hypothetical protein [Clostridium botulinum]MBE1302951.1 hypothetical protein [Clostridium botulinum]